MQIFFQRPTQQTSFLKHSEILFSLEKVFEEAPSESNIKMTAKDEKEKEQSDVDKSNKAEKSEFRLGILPLDPLFVLIALIYGITRSERLRLENVSTNNFFLSF